MKTEKLNYDLPAELVAQTPTDVRSCSRLLVLDRHDNQIVDTTFDKIGDFLLPGDCLVLNDTKVLAARFFGRRKSSGRFEGLFLSEENGVWLVMLKNARRLKGNEIVILADKDDNDYCEAEVVEKLEGGKWLLKPIIERPAESILSKIGFAPLPPYIKRDDPKEMAHIDDSRYQTVYAKTSGAVAAPTAGLHFTEELIGQLEKKCVDFAHLTLHVGAGTFKPVSAEDIDDHEIHSEIFNVSAEAVEKIKNAKQDGHRVIAVGTTSVRTLETVAGQGGITPASGATKLFIKPGYEFKAIDAMITNFHLPKSTLIALVGAFAGLDNILNAYKHAIEERYRFYSYGDAMLII